MKKEIFIGPMGIGGNHPVSIQSMTSTPTADIQGTLNQIYKLKDADCDLVRLALPDLDSIKALSCIIKRSPLPIIGDVHFDANLAVRALHVGVDGLRINPGNIGSKIKLKEIIQEAKRREIPIRIGVNAGSLSKKSRQRALPLWEKMVALAIDYVHFFEDEGFDNIKVSIKASNVIETVKAYQSLDRLCNYPLHLGITEAGTIFPGAIKSAVGIGSLLLQGIGNTIRVSLTADPVEEVKVAKEILAAVGLRIKKIDIISCPTCSRTSVDLIGIVTEFEEKISQVKLNKMVKVAIMGCEVNGPGEAADADIGLAFSRQVGYIFKKGKIVEKVSPEKSVERLIELMINMF